MILTEDQAQHFYALWMPLLDYVNESYHVSEKLRNMPSQKTMDPNEVVKVSKKLWENKDVIDAYIDSRCMQLAPEDIQTIRSWKRAISGGFIVERHLKKGSVLISLENEEVYIVKGIYSSWQELLQRFSMPAMVEATILHYEGVIINDGLVGVRGISFGKNVREQFSRTYRTAKENGTLHFEL